MLASGDGCCGKKLVAGCRDSEVTYGAFKNQMFVLRIKVNY